MTRRYVWTNSGLEDVPLRIDDSASRPSGSLRSYARWAKKLGDVDRVEVPFEFVVPKQEDYWTADASGGIDVPLGRAGAMKLQHLALGRGTAQHVLVSGKTGSGKSNLLHAIITNVALWYGPHEVEMYLVDFKKGVEFKAYSQNELPHARVIAIESEREFGQSVLERLDAELKRRGDIFRGLGVQNLEAYRKARRGRNHAAGAAGDRRVPGAFCGRRPSSLRNAALLLDPLGSPGTRLRHARFTGLANAGRVVFATSARPSGKWPCASPCNAARPTRI